MLVCVSCLRCGGLGLKQAFARGFFINKTLRCFFKTNGFKADQRRISDESRPFGDLLCLDSPLESHP